MYLHKDDKELLRDIIVTVSERTGIDESIVEKDYYVTMILKELVQRNPNVVFKGGTSLSKAYHVIDRFSEDIDMHLESEKPEGIKSKLKKTTMMVFAVTLHNIPEGMAVGVTFAGALAQNAGITMAGAFALAVGIAIQNFPEGAIISMPLKSEGVSKPRAFLYGALSGIVEPIGALITILLTNAVVPILPYLLSFAAGAMIYVVVEELIPESQAGEHSNIGTIGVAIGFIIMMILDVALG